MRRLSLLALPVALVALTGCGVLSSVLGGTPSVKVGECTAALTGTQVDTIKKIACDQPHYWEAYAEKSLTDASYPGENAIVKQSEDFCKQAFEPYVGIAADDSEYDVQYLYPTDSSWKRGDRLISCLVGRDAGGITKSLKDAKA